MGMAYKNAKSAMGLGRVTITLTGTPPSGASVTMTKDGSSETKEFGTSGTVTFYFNDEGTCSLSASVNLYGLPGGVTLVKGGQYELMVYAGTDDFGIWAATGGLSPSDYASLAALCADADAMEILMNTALAVEYMMDSTAVIMPAVVASATAFSAMDASSYAIGTAMGSAVWWAAIRASAACISTMDASAVKIPAMTSNTAPSGAASASSVYSVNPDGWQPYKAFRGNERWLADVMTYAGAQWLQYDFHQPIRGYKFSLAWSTSGYYEIQAWVNGAWVQCAQNKITDGGSNSTSIVTNNPGQCFSTPVVSSRYRLYSHYANCDPPNGSTHQIGGLQIYGKEPVS